MFDLIPQDEKDVANSYTTTTMKTKEQQHFMLPLGFSRLVHSCMHIARIIYGATCNMLPSYTVCMCCVNFEYSATSPWM